MRCFVQGSRQGGTEMACCQLELFKVRPGRNQKGKARIFPARLCG
jgi:hypothetical protein